MHGSSVAAPRVFRAGRALGWIAGFGAFGLGLSAVYATTGFGFGCPFKALTGWDCPLCGGTRLGAALLHGDVAAAFVLNPLVFIGLVLLAALAVAWGVEAAGGPRLRVRGAARALLARVTPTGWLLIALGVAAVYTVLRNLL